jgi:RNA polymerase sigma-70 factor (ECF subfamily)
MPSQWLITILALLEFQGTNAPEGLSQGSGTHSGRTKADSELVSAAQAGDVDAFEELVRKHQKRMLNIAYRMIGNYEDACETVQETFLSAYRSIKRFRKEAAFSTWLCAICLNHSRNRLKQTRSRTHHEVQLTDDPTDTQEASFARETTSDCLSIVEQMERKELQEKVQECMNRLDDEHREVLVLRDIQGYSYDEIRDILKIPDGTVKSRLFRARDALRESVQKALGEL